MTPADLPARWRDRAGELARYAPAAAQAFRDAAVELEAALADTADEELSLAEAARTSGYSSRRLRELLAAGTVPMAPGGRRGRPRIRRGDLPRRAGRADANTCYDPVSDAAVLLARGAS
jgi:hypothetical protein